MMIDALKGFYQTTQIRTSIFFANLFSVHKNNEDLVRQKLDSKKFSWDKNKKTKIFAAFSIVNWETNLLEELKKMGECYHFSWPIIKDFFKSKNDWQAFHNQLNIDLQKAFDGFYDTDSNIIVFIYASDFTIGKYFLESIQQPNVLVISFCWDDLLYFTGYVKDQPIGIKNLSHYADINLTLSPETIPRYTYHNNACFFWDAVSFKNSSYFKPIETKNGNESFYVLFIGSKYGWRASFIKRLINAGIEVRTYGHGWDNGILTNDKMKDAIQKAPVTLGFSNVGYTKKITTLKGRDFEVPLYGGLYLTQYSEGLARYYQPGKEIFTYINFSDCLQQVKQIRDNYGRAAAVRAAGQRKAAENAGWASRFAFLNSLIDKLTIDYTLHK